MLVNYPNGYLANSVCIYLAAGNTHHTLELQWQLTIPGRPHAEPHQLDVARVRRLEPCVSKQIALVPLVHALMRQGNVGLKTHVKYVY